MKKISSATAWIIVLVLVILASLALLETSKNAGVISYNQFKQYWNENKISRIQVNENRMTVVGELRDQNKTQFEATVPQELLIEDLMVKTLILMLKLDLNLQHQCLYG